MDKYEEELQLVEDMTGLDFPNLWKLVEQATPPTEEEVCKALREELECKVFISTDNIIQIRRNEETKENYCIELWDGQVDFDSITLPPKLITMIGRFYEGLNDNIL